MGLGSFCELLVAGQQRAGGGFPRLCWAERGRPGGASGGRQDCLLGYPGKPGQASRTPVTRGVGLPFADWQIE